MHVLISHDDFSQRMQLKIAFKKAGFTVTSTGRRAEADAFLRRQVVDVLVVAERVEGHLTHALALLAECRNPMVETILMTSRNDGAVEELYVMLPSLHCLVGPDVPAKLITKLAIAAVQGATDRSVPMPLLESYRIDDETGINRDVFLAHLRREPAPSALAMA